MLAKVKIILPYTVTHPEMEKFDIHKYHIESYEVSFLPFLRSERADQYSNVEEVSLNGVRASQYDVLQINFFKKEFERKPIEEFDPPLDMIEKVANDFLSRLRYVSNSSQSIVFAM